MAEETVHLAGKLLVAMPGMGDPRFAHSVIYMCAHDDEGSMGLIVNKPQTNVDFSNLLEELEIARGPNARDIRVHFGGPVELGRGFVLHSSDYAAAHGTLQVDDHVGMTATLEVLEDLAQGKGPKTSMLALGYAGWGPGQLDREIARNGWLICDPREDIIFGRANEHKWTGALKMMGIDPLLLSETAGRA
ncbi:YqgE/AlgH family protein [Cognatiyoonia sp. IB215446]|uniref:YqgE/AlgH family protein n=1 Tax=Cognatiyoonia sp. IB215446 TaxID=3097355 RepID=UPI002A1444AD|nr:YqgE/AlgH family protein [Cognatiyoonia sp. IB215446]MDX8350061.1 YqgE/AlgH family protein [Cognatiyoonia sp. IB215446]